MFGRKEETEFFYRCVMRVDMIYLSPRNRDAEKMNLSITERMKMGFNEQLYPHPFRFKPADPMIDRPADVLQTERPIASHFTEAKEKMVSRPQMDPRGFPMSRAREMRSKMTKIKFELIENPSESERKRAIPLRLRDIDYADAEEKESTPTEKEPTSGRVW
jgi:hypothetical protein